MKISGFNPEGSWLYDHVLVMITQFSDTDFACTMGAASALMVLLGMHSSSLPESLEYLIMSFHDLRMTHNGVM